MSAYINRAGAEINAELFIAIRIWSVEWIKHSFVQNTDLSRTNNARYWNFKIKIFDEFNLKYVFEDTSIDNRVIIEFTTVRYTNKSVR